MIQLKKCIYTLEHFWVALVTHILENGILQDMLEEVKIFILTMALAEKCHYRLL